MASKKWVHQSKKKDNILSSFLDSFLVKIVISIVLILVLFLILWQFLLLLKASHAPKAVMTIIASIWGVGGILLLYMITNWLVSRFSDKWYRRFTPWVFLGPALVILLLYLVIPAILSFYYSMLNGEGNFIFLANYAKAFGNSDFIVALRNNIIWIVFGTGLCVFFGLLIAILADRSSFERIAKSLIFLPMAISFISAGVIWKFIYAYKPADAQQIGLLNAVVMTFGHYFNSVFSGSWDFGPHNWIILKPYNNFFLAIILVWMYTGYAMVVFSAAIKGVPDELIEAARIDGAGEFKIISSIVIPYIKGTIITVATTIIILSLKIFDIVWSTTYGYFDTHVIATLQFKEMFVQKNDNMAATYAVFLLLAVIPAVIYNLKQFKDREEF